MASTARRGVAARGAGRASRFNSPAFRRWSKLFLAELAATSNVSAAARAAKITTFTAYEARRENAEFNRAWQRALCEGYDNLELDLLRRLREGELKPAAAAKKAVRTYDNATALRLLGAHRDSVARERALREDLDAEAIVASLNAKLERMRERALAARGESDPDGQQRPAEMAAFGTCRQPPRLSCRPVGGREIRAGPSLATVGPARTAAARW